MLITPFLFRSEAAQLNISNEIGPDWYSDVVEVEGSGSTGVARYGTTGCGLEVCNFGINIGGGCRLLRNSNSCKSIFSILWKCAFCIIWATKNPK